MGNRKGARYILLRIYPKLKKKRLAGDFAILILLKQKKISLDYMRLLSFPKQLGAV